MMKSYTKKIKAGLMTLLLGLSPTIYGQYCTPTYSTGCSFGDDLNDVQLDGLSVSLSNLNSGCNGNYTDNTSMNAPDLSAGLVFTLKVGTSYSSPQYESVKVWIDYDENDVFDAGEEIGSISGMSAGLNSIDFTVPATTTLGIKRMRVKVDYTTDASSITACGSANYGETEDYSVEIVSAPSCVPPQNLMVSNGTPTSIDFGWTEMNSATEWEVEYGAIGFTLGTGTNANTTSNPYNAAITLGDEYDFYVRAICAVGDTSFWKGPLTVKYCEVSTSYGEYLSEITSAGAIQNISYTASSQPIGSYADETTQSFESFESQVFDINTTYSSGSNGVSIYADWNNDMTFDATELVTTQAGTNASQTLSFQVPPGTPIGDYRVRIRGQWGSSSNPPACGNVNYGSTVDFTLTVAQAPSCLPPSNLSASGVTSSSVDLAWNENGTATLWNVDYREVAVGGPWQQITGATSNPLTITGLNSNTEYEFRVQADCGGGDTSYFSSEYGPILTECTSYLANGFCEGFDINLSPYIGCWRVRDENGDGDHWQVSTSNPNTGAYSAVMYTDFNSGNNDDYLISPALTLTGIEAMKFSYAVQSASEPNDFQVLLSTTGTDVVDFTDTLMALAQYSNTDYKDTVVDLTMYTGDVYVAFHVPPGGLDGYYLYIDDVCFGECIPTPGQDGSFDVCMLDDEVDLSNNIVSHINSYGRWEFPANQNLIVDDTMFNVSNMVAGSHEVLYIVEGLCQEDTTIATINVYEPSSAGIDGTLEVCKNTPTNLFSGLSGNVDLGGQWYDPAFNTISSQPNASNIPGQFQYTYIVDNGLCPSDTSIVTVTVDGTCDNLSVGNDVMMDISVYPNPAKSQVTISNPSNVSSLNVEMLDMNGRVVLTENKTINNASEATINIEKLERGIYTLNVFNNEGQKTFKIVKQ